MDSTPDRQGLLRAGFRDATIGAVVRSWTVSVVVWFAAMAASCGRAVPAAEPAPSPAPIAASAEGKAVQEIEAQSTEPAASPIASSRPGPAREEPPAACWSELEIPGHEPAIVSLPGAALEPRPVVVAAHGLGEDPKEWCTWCRELVGPRPVILCLRGSATGRTQSHAMSYAHTSPRVMRQEAVRGMQALQARHPGQVDTREAVFVGFSLGANTGAQVVLEEPAAFPRAVLIEGGNELWDRKSAPRFHDAGGRRILFACGTEGCRRWAAFSRRRLEKAGVAVKIAAGDGGGHTYREGPVGEAVRRVFSWVVEDDSRWKSREPLPGSERGTGR